MNGLPILPLQQWGGTAPVNFDTPLTIALVLLFFALMIGIGVVAGRYQSSEIDYYAAGRRSGIFVIALSGFAAIQSGWGLVGITGSVYAAGAEVFLLIFTPLAFVFSYWILGKKMRLLGTYKNAVTAPDALYHRFGESDHVRLLGALSIFLGCIGYLAAQYAALGIIGAVVLPFDFYGALIVGMVVVGIYTVIGGSLAAIWSDAIQGAIMAISGPLVFFYIVTQVDMDLNTAVSTILEDSARYFNLAFLGGETILGIGFTLSMVFLMITTAGQPQLTTKFYMIRDVSLLKWGALISGTGYLLTMFYWLAAPYIRAGVIGGTFPSPPTSDGAMPVALVNSAPEFVVALVLTAVFAAIMSTSNAFLNLAAAAVQHDIIQEYSGRDLSDSEQVLWGRGITVAVLLAAFIVAASFPGVIMVLGSAGWGLLASVIFPGVAIAYNWKSATREGIIAGGWVALIGTLAFAFGGRYLGWSLPMGFLGGQVAGFTGLVVFVVVSIFTSTADYSDLTDNDVKKVIDAGRLGSGGAESSGTPVTADDD